MKLGQIKSTTKIAPGIFWLESERFRGVWLLPTRDAKMPDDFRALARPHAGFYGGPRWCLPFFVFEADIAATLFDPETAGASWASVIASGLHLDKLCRKFPTLFDKYVVQDHPLHHPHTESDMTETTTQNEQRLEAISSRAAQLFHVNRHGIAPSRAAHIAFAHAASFVEISDQILAGEIPIDDMARTPPRRAAVTAPNLEAIRHLPTFRPQQADLLDYIAAGEPGTFELFLEERRARERRQALAN